MEGILSSWVGGSLVILVWSSKAFYWFCSSEQNPLVTKSATSKGTYRSPNKDEYDVVVLVDGGAGDKLKKKGGGGGAGVSTKLYGGSPTLVVNMSVFGSDTLLSEVHASYGKRGLKAPTFVSINRPSHLAPPLSTIGGEVVGIHYVTHTTPTDLIAVILGVNPNTRARALQTMLTETRVVGLPPDFDPAHHMLDTASAATFDPNQGLEPAGSPVSFAEFDGFFCGNRGCRNMAQSDFDCECCLGFFCSEECREMTCGDGCS